MLLPRLVVHNFLSRAVLPHLRFALGGRKYPYKIQNLEFKMQNYLSSAECLLLGKFESVVLSQLEVLTEIDLSYHLVLGQLLGSTHLENLTFVEQV